MAYTLNEYFQVTFTNPDVPRVIVYPNKIIASQLLNHHDNGSTVVTVADCLSDTSMNLPMPHKLMKIIDTKIRALNGRALVVGLDAYLALLDTDCVTTFMFELRDRIDAQALNADYLLSIHKKPIVEPRYEEARSVIYINGDGEELKSLCIQAYSDEWVKADGIVGYKILLERLNSYMPSGNYELILKGLTEKQAGIGNAVSFVCDIHDVARQYYDIDADLDDFTLEILLRKLSECNKQRAEDYLSNQFGDIRHSLKRLLELASDPLWSAYIWWLQKRLSNDSYIAKVISGDITSDTLLRKYVVDTAVTVLSDVNKKKYASERAETLKTLNTNYEALIVEFIDQTKDHSNALWFLNCGTTAERIEILRRVSSEDLSHGLPRQYGELFPTLADYFSSDFDYGDEAVNAYFKEYRRLKMSNSITDSFVQRAYNFTIPKTYSMRDALIAELQGKSDTALLVVDAMGAEYMPLLLALAKRHSMNIESQAIVVAKLPTTTKFNSIKWNETWRLDEVKSLDNTVHYGASKNEVSTAERNFESTLYWFEKDIMGRIAQGLTLFDRIVVTADHGSSRLAVIARNENKATTLPWETARDGQPIDWRYSRAPSGTKRPPEFESTYDPDKKETYWIVRGYNRLPKMGGKLYELHGGATLEELLVPVIVFMKSTATQVPTQPDKKSSSELVDEFEGLV